MIGPPVSDACDRESPSPVAAGSRLVRGGLERLGDAVVEHPRDAEVEHLHVAALGDEDVAGLEIAVDDAVLVGALEGAQHGQEQLGELARRHGRAFSTSASVLPSRSTRAPCRVMPWYSPTS